MPIEVNGTSYETDEEGYLLNLAEWTTAMNMMQQMRMKMKQLRIWLAEALCNVYTL